MTGVRGATGDGGRPDWAAVLFDLDGTLADTVELILRCYRHTMQVHLGEAPPDADWLAGIGRPLRDQLGGFARDVAEVAAMAETYSAFQHTIHDQQVAPFPGVAEALDALCERGVPVGVVTSKRGRMAARTLACCGLDGACRIVISADDVERGKPDPEPVLRALDRLGIRDTAARTLFVGDSPFDLQAGRAAGTKTAAVLWGPFAEEVLLAERPDYVVRSPAELVALRP